MDATVVLLIIGYVVLGYLLLLFNLRTGFPWFLKAVMVLIVTFFYVFTYNSYKSLLGWPTKDFLPERFRLIAAQIYEPNVILNSEGSIYVWITDMNDQSGLSTPRSFQITYNKETHEKLSKALVNIKNGIPQMGENLEEEEESGVISKILGRKKAVATSSKLSFFDMPNQLLPEK